MSRHTPAHDNKDLIAYVQGMSLGTVKYPNIGYIDPEPTEVEASGLREHSFKRALHTFVKFSVDGQHTISTPVYKGSDEDNPKWYNLPNEPL